MRKPPAFVVVIAVAVPLLLAIVAISVLVTIPPAPDPDTMSSHMLEPPSPAYRVAVEESRSIARALIAEEKLPGLSVAIAVDGDLVWAEGFRWADMENETPVTPATLFRIGGISECITAAAIGLLCDRVQLDLDVPVQTYVADFPEMEWPISVRQLMSHTSGLRHHGGDGGIFRGGPCANDTERLALLAVDALQFAPGSEIHYSTGGWVLVGAVVAKVANEPYLDFIQREILMPLGMNSTVPDILGSPDARSAQFYYPRMMLDPGLGLQDAPTVDLSCYQPAVGFLSTPGDLVRLGSAMMSDTLLDPATAEELCAPVRLASGQLTNQALGWTVHNVTMGSSGTLTQVVGQGLGESVLRRPLSATTTGGHVSGGTASLMLLPEHHIAIAVASNVSGAENVSLLTTRLADVFVRFIESSGRQSDDS